MLAYEYSFEAVVVGQVNLGLIRSPGHPSLL